MNLDNVVLDYEITLPGKFGNEVVFEEGKYYSYVYDDRPGAVKRFIYIDKIITSQFVEIYKISPYIRRDCYVIDTRIVPLRWLQEECRDYLCDEGLGERMSNIPRLDGESIEEWTGRGNSMPCIFDSIIEERI